MFDFLEEYGISPTVGVVLMVAITVILSVTVAYTVLGIGNNTTQSANAGVEMQETADGTEIKIQNLGGGTESLQVTANGTTLKDNLTVGDTVTVTAPKGETISVVGVSKDGSRNTIEKVTTSQNTGTLSIASSNTGGGDGGSGPAPSYSTASASAPSNLSKTLNNMAGNGTTSNPYQITNDQELQAMNADLDANYELANNIGASKTSQWHDGNGFNTIGGVGGYAPSIGSSYAAGVSGFGPASQADSSQDKFTGTLDGNGYEIRGLTINRSDETRVGFIDFLGGNGVVKNIGIVDANVSGNSRTGILVGESSGKVVSSYSTGTVKIPRGEGKKYVGGLVGYNNNLVTKSYSEADVTGGERAGVLVGKNENTGSIVSKSYSDGSVNGTIVVGGLVGQNYGDIKSSYSLSSAYGEQAVGGISHNGDVHRSYAAGLVESESSSGGVLQDQFYADSGELYWDKQATNQSRSAGPAVGLNTSEMTGSAAKSNMSGLDFDGNWTTTADGYPILKWQNDSS